LEELSDLSLEIEDIFKEFNSYSKEYQSLETKRKITKIEYERELIESAEIEDNLIIKEVYSEILNNFKFKDSN